MKLRLSLTKGQQVFSGHSSSHEFSEAGGTLGRSVRSDWVLDDPTRVVSGIHAEIGFADGRFTVTDRSINGVYLNDSETSLGSGNSAPVQNGDRLVIGDFEIGVEVIDEDTSDVQEMPQMAPWPVSEELPMTPPVPPHPEGLAPDLQHFGPSQADQVPALLGNIADLGEIRPGQPEPHGAPSVDQGGVPSEALPWDFSDLAENLEPPPAEPPLEQRWEPLPAEPPPVQRWEPPPAEPPQVQPADSGQIPPQQLPPTEEIGADAPTEEPWEADRATEPVPPEHMYEPPPAVPPMQPAPPQPPDAMRAPDSELVARAPRPQPAAPPAPAAHHPAEAGIPRACGDLSQALEALLAGAGVPDLRVPGGADPQFFRAVGELLALYASGTTEVLRTISEIKDTFRISQTQVQQSDNNPLRWVVTSREAMKRLLAPEEDGYLPPHLAVKDAFASINAHQIGSIRGMEAALKQFLNEQDPTELERGFEHQGRPGILTNKAAWCWQQYAVYHRRLTENAHDNVLDLLGSAFSTAYEQQIRRIRSQQR